MASAYRHFIEWGTNLLSVRELGVKQFMSETTVGELFKIMEQQSPCVEALVHASKYAFLQSLLTFYYFQSSCWKCTTKVNSPWFTSYYWNSYPFLFSPSLGLSFLRGGTRIATTNISPFRPCHGYRRTASGPGRGLHGETSLYFTSGIAVALHLGLSFYREHTLPNDFY